MGSWTDVLLSGNVLQGVPVFDTEDDEANKYYGQVERDVIKGASIGIIPLAVDGNEITACELLEISITPVPANRNALVIYNAKGQKLNAKEAKAYMLSINSTQTETDKNSKTMDKDLLAALVLLCANAGITVQLSADSKNEDAVNAINKVGNIVTSLKLTNTQLKASNDAYQVAELNAKNAEAASTVDAAIADKRITAAQRETFIKLFAADADLAKSTLEALKPVQLTAIPGAAAAQQVAGREAWTLDDWAKNDSVGLSAMQVNEPEKFNALYEAKVTNLKAAGAIA